MNMAKSNSRVLVMNGGSSSVKLSLFDRSKSGNPDDPLLWSDTLSINLLESSADEVHQVISDQLRKAGFSLDSISCVGHRVVHGGTRLRTPVEVDAGIENKIEQLVELAPVHNPVALKLMRESRRLFAQARQIAVFDTAFHQTLPEVAFVYPVPFDWYQNLGIRRFGFHGINHEYCMHAAAKMLKMEPAQLKLVNCHLGNGCSLAAVRDGKCIDTSMGFTPLEGLMMGARSGSIDPGILVYLLREQKLSLDELDEALNNASGLLGISGLSKDMQNVQQAMDDENERSKLAFEIFVDRLKKGIASMVAALEGVNTIVFTAGIGEHSARVRKTVCQGLKFLGVDLDDDKNANCTADGIISSARSKVHILRITAREDLQIFRECIRLIS